jgi:threonine dehydrogenase-like Zn-dependent dehydrogenase
MQTLSLLPTQIQNRVGLLQQQQQTNIPPYPPDTYGNFQPPAGNIDSYNPYAQGSVQPPAPYEMPSNQQPIASPAYAAPLAVAAAPVSFWKKPVTWVLGGAGAVGLGALAYFKLDWIKDKLGIGGNEGKLERAKTQFEALKTNFKNAETDEEKKNIVTKMLAVLERNEGALLKDLPKGALNAYATELRALKDSGNKFAQTALTKAGKEIVKNATDGVKTGSKDLVKAINNSGTLDTIIRVGAVAATIPLWWSVALTSGLAGWLGSLGIGTAIAGIGSSIGATASGTVATIAAVAATPAAGTAGTVALATATTATAINPEVVKTPVKLLGDVVLFIPRAIGKGLKNLRP